MCGQVTAAATLADEVPRLVADTGASEHLRTVTAVFAEAFVATLTGDRAMAIGRLDDAAALCQAPRAAYMLRMCDLGAVLIHARPSYLADVEPSLKASPLALVHQFVMAASARQHARQSDVSGAEPELRATTPHELSSRRGSRCS